MPTASLLLCFEDELALARQTAEAAGMALACIDRHVFPDGEVKLRLPPDLPAQVVVLRSLHDPNTRLIELMLAARTARALGASHLTLVAPYLAYMRQDVAFVPGEAVSQRIIGAYLADLFDAVITVDPHLHRVATLQEAVPAQQALALTAAPLLADFVFGLRPGALLIGPDEESAQWISAAARQHRFDHGVCHKTRHGDRQVEISLPDIAVAGRHVVLLDDIASSGHTLAQAARLLLQAGAVSVDVAVTHALFSGDALEVVRNAGVGQIWSTDSVRHQSNRIGIAGLLAAALRPS
ncbi:MAG: ribose-phosphate diphosphokinase [Limnohabitans sp.]